MYCGICNCLYFIISAQSSAQESYSPRGEVFALLAKFQQIDALRTARSGIVVTVPSQTVFPFLEITSVKAAHYLPAEVIDHQFGGSACGQGELQTAGSCEGIRARRRGHG